MLSLLVALTLATPPDFDLPVAKAVELPTGLSKVWPEAGRRDIRGCIVADDGSAVFWGRDGLSKVDVQDRTFTHIDFFQRNWLPDEPPITETQRAWVESVSGFDKSKQRFEGAGAIRPVSARDRNSVLLEYSFHPAALDQFRASLGGISLDSKDPKSNKSVLNPTKEGFLRGVVADLSSNALLGEYYKDKSGTYDYSDYRLMGANEAIKGHLVPGIVPTIFDSTRDIIVCFTFTEEGTPYALLVEHLKSEEERQTVYRPGGRVSVTGLLPRGRIVTTCLPFRDDDEVNSKTPKWGLYQCDPPYDKAKYLGPYRLVGSSRNGEWLLIAHLQTQKAWLVKPS